MNGGTANDFFVVETGFGNDTINGFDANPAGGQELIDLTALGIGIFNTDVTITGNAANTLVTVAGGTIALSGVNVATVTEADFIF
jgi:hypothetical protein